MSIKQRQEVFGRVKQLALHVVAFSIGIGFVTFVWIDRREVFSRLKYSIFDGELALPYGWAIVAVGLLMMQYRGSSGHRFLRSMQLVLATSIVLIAVGLLIGQSDWTRYQVYRLETFGTHYGLSARDRSQTELDLVGLVDKPAIGRWLRQDAEMLQHLAIERGTLFAREPDTARITLASLVATGMTLDDLMARKEAMPFLLYALAGEVYAGEEQKHWADSQSSIILGEMAEEVDALSGDELEALFFCIANRRTLIDEAGHQRVLSAWLERVPQFSSLLGEGLRLGEAMNAAITAAEIGTIGLSVNEGYRLPYEATRDRLPVVMKRSMQTLLNLTETSGVQVVSTDPDLAITLQLGGESLHEYQEQIMEWRSKFEMGRTSSMGGRRFYRPGRMVMRSVPSGETRTVLVRGATVALEIPFATDPITTEATLAYWSDYLRDEDDASLDSVDYEQLSGRVWPLGIHQSYFLAGADDETQNK